MNKTKKISLLCSFIAGIAIGYAQDYFITTWNTEAGEQTGSTTIRLPIYGGAYDVDIDNDGTFEMTDLTGRQIIDFDTPGEYTIAVRPNVANTAGKLQIYHNGGSTPKKLMSIKKWGNIVWTSMSRAFQGCENLTIADTAGVPDLSMVTDMSWAFSRATYFTGNLSGWEVSNVTNMVGTFFRANSFTSDLGGWDVSNVTNMIHMFAGATGFSTKDYDKLLLGWLKRGLKQNVTFTAPPIHYCEGNDARNMMVGDYEWTIRGDGPFVCPFVSVWDTKDLSPQITLPISGGSYDVDIDNDGVYELKGRQGKVVIDNLPQGIHTITICPNAMNAQNKLRINFGSLQSEALKIVSIEKWGTVVWTSMQNAFQGCKYLRVNDPEAPNLSMVTNMDSMFFKAENLTFRSALEWNTSGVTDMRNIFEGAMRFNSDIGSWNTSKVTDMCGLLSQATAFDKDLSEWDTSKVTNMSGTFFGATNFTSNIGCWNVSQVMDMTDMLTGAASFKAQDYEALLLGWSKVNVQPNVTFGAPPVKYCNGKKGREKLTDPVMDDGYNWNISGDRGLGCSDLALSIDAFLQGPYDTNRMMNASLLTANNGANIIPTETPYGDGATVEITVFDDTTDLMDQKTKKDRIIL